MKTTWILAVVLTTAVAVGGGYLYMTNDSDTYPDWTELNKSEGTETVAGRLVREVVRDENGSDTRRLTLNGKVIYEVGHLGLDIARKFDFPRKTVLILEGANEGDGSKRFLIVHQGGAVSFTESFGFVGKPKRISVEPNDIIVDEESYDHVSQQVIDRYQTKLSSLKETKFIDRVFSIAKGEQPRQVEQTRSVTPAAQAQFAPTRQTNDELRTLCIRQARDEGYRSGQCAYSFIRSCIETQSRRAMDQAMKVDAMLGMDRSRFCPNMPEEYVDEFDRL